MKKERGFLLKYQSMDIKPGLVFFGFALLWDIKEKIPFFKNSNFKGLRFFKANRLGISQAASVDTNNLTIDLVFVCAGKDFEILPFSIKYALSATEDYEVNKIIVVVPQNDFLTAKELFSNYDKRIKVLNENDVLSEQKRVLLRIKFEDRYGWALQQILKVSAVISSTSHGVLIVDSDTLLMSKRKWLSKDGVQLLTPSWEYNASYYSFLAKFGMSQLNPTHTFISHHMLMQPKLMRGAMNQAGWSNIDSLIDALVTSKFLSKSSPFCIEYELYGQYLWEFHREKVRLEKWANAGLPRSAFKEFGNPQGYSIEDFEKFASLSLHSYL